MRKCIAAVAALASLCGALRPPPSAGIGRRQALLGGAAGLVAPGLVPALAAPDVAADIERTIPVATLVASLAVAPRRDVVITGANSGVGLAGAKLLTAAGHRVVLACRTQAKADAAAAACAAYAATAAGRPGGSARGAECDLASLASVRAFASSLKGAKLDSLVLNAGLAAGQGDKEPRRTVDGFELTVGTNHLGHFLLADLLAPTLAGGTKPRLVVTASPVHDPTSGGGNVGSPATLGDLSGLAAAATSAAPTAKFEMVDGGPYDADKAYKDSKLCNMLFVAEASRRLAPRGVSANAFSPGLIADPNGFFRNQNPTFAKAFNQVSKLAGVAETNEFGGSALAYMAVDEALDGVTGAWYDTLPPGKHQLAVHAPSEEARRVETQRRLWELSEQLVD